MAADTTKKHFIRIRGANVNNLKNLSVDIPRDKFVVFTGLSGSGKSSLAFDTIYAEGQRRYMESLSSYARQFLGQMEKPDVESIEGLPPAISIDQKSTYKNYEYIIVENNSTDDKTFAYYKELEASNPKAHVVYWDREFNYSAINNYGASFAKGEYILLLNNDTEIINDDCLEELLGYCMRSDVGAVGARMYYEDDTIQHAGVVLGTWRHRSHIMCRASKEDPGYFGRMISVQEISAVTSGVHDGKEIRF